MVNPISAADQLDAAVAEFLEGEAAGRPADRAELLGRFAAVQDELKSFFEDHDRMHRMSAPLRGLTGHGRSASTSGYEPTIGDKSSFFVRENNQPDQVGRYRIEEEIGRGGMGVVYRAWDEKLGRPVALKMIPSGGFASDADLERFRSEARLAAGLSHPSIVPIFEAGEWQGLPYFAMALVEGRSLSDLIREGPLDPLLAAKILRKVAEAVASAHAAGVIHRDLKPANILLSSAAGGSGEIEPAVTDFGLARRLDGESHLTCTGQVLGTPAYMSPEQATGSQKGVNEATDIYALGAILYAMLTGRPPFQADSPVEVILQVLESDPPLPRRLNPQVPKWLEAICLRCLEKDPARRYSSATSLVSDLERFLRREPPEAMARSPFTLVRRWIRRQPVVSWHLAGLGTILLLMQVIFLFHPERDWNYHVKVCAPLIAWMLGCGLLGFFANNDTFRDRVHFLWSALDIVFLTLCLAVLERPVTLHLASYLILICASGLFFRPRLVAFTTAWSIAGSLCLAAIRPEDFQPWHHALVFEAMLVLAGVVVGYQVWRFTILREYYEKRK